MIDYAEALSLTLDTAVDFGTERVPLAQATGRILRQEVVADRDQPPFDRVAMDGLALDYSAYAAGRRRFAVSHMAPAGRAPRPVSSGDHCVEVMTGAPLPPGTTAVIRYEDVERVGAEFIVPDGVTDGQNIHPQATDGRSGDSILRGPVRIGPTQAAVLATYGVPEVTVGRWPRVAIASTGDEIVPVEQPPLDHQIRSSNVYQLAALFRQMGIEPTVDHLGDDPAGGQATLNRLLEEHDLLLLSGGVSKGKLDHVPDWLAGAGVEKLFHRVAQRPGKPLWVGRNASTMVFALPGNPASSLVGAVAYLGPWLRRALGVERPNQLVNLLDDVVFAPSLTLFRSVRLEPTPGGTGARPVANSGSGDLVSLARTDGFLVLPADRVNFSAGEIFPYLPIGLL